MSPVEYITVKAIRLAQPIGSFFIASFPYASLCKIAWADVRRLKDEHDFETYLGIQRPLNPGRVKEIKKYVHTIDATFPTSIIIAVDGRCVTWDEQAGQLTFSEYAGESADDPQAITTDKIARVLDGQHRIAGLMDFHVGDFDLNVAIFVDIDIAEQASIFSVVNITQTKINKSLLYDLFELAKTRSPQKTCHNIAVVLDKSSESPFYHRIKRLGVATEGKFGELITQAAFVESLLPFVSEDPKKDRDLLLRGKEPLPCDDFTKVPFRKFFLEKCDGEIVKIVWNYFAAVEERWPKAWDDQSKGNMLCKTNGFMGLMRVLRLLYPVCSTDLRSVPAASEFLKKLEKVEMADADFSTDKFPPGSAGQAGLFQTVATQLGLIH